MVDERAPDSDLKALRAARARATRAIGARRARIGWLASIATITAICIGSIAVGFAYAVSTEASAAVGIVVSIGVAAVAFTVLGLVAILYPGTREQIDRESAEAATLLETKMERLRVKVDVSASKGAQSRGPYASPGAKLSEPDLHAAEAELRSSVEAMERARERS